MPNIYDPLANRFAVATDELLGMRRIVWVSAALLIGAIVLGQFEPRIAPAANSVPSSVTSVLNRIEAFGHAVGAFFIIATAATISSKPRRTALLLGITTLSCGLFADLIKLFVIRYRPNGLTMDMTSSPLQFSPALVDSWQEFFVQVRRSELHSFPSAHTAVAFGLALSLSVIAPRGRALYFSLAALVGVQRVVIRSHFPSDVLAGAAISLLVGAMIIRSIQRREQRAALAATNSASANTSLETSVTDRVAA